MKAFYTLILLVFLASCGNWETPVVETSTTPTPVQEVTAEIDEASQALPQVEEVIDTTDAQETTLDNDAEAPALEAEKIEEAETEEESTEASAPEEANTQEVTEEVSTKTVELSTTYNNPKIEVIMDIALDVDDEGKISQISVTSPNYQGMPEFNKGVQWVIGLTLEEASEYVVSGSSLTTPAFQSALKQG